MSDEAIVLIVLAQGILLCVAIWVIWTPTKAQKEKDELKLSEWTCPKCGRTNVAAGAEKYHLERCHGRRTQQNQRWKGGGHVEK